MSLGKLHSRNCLVDLSNFKYYVHHVCKTNISSDYRLLEDLIHKSSKTNKKNKFKKLEEFDLSSVLIENSKFFGIVVECPINLKGEIGSLF